MRKTRLTDRYVAVNEHTFLLPFLKKAKKVKLSE